ACALIIGGGGKRVTALPTFGGPPPPAARGSTEHKGDVVGVAGRGAEGSRGADPPRGVAGPGAAGGPPGAVTRGARGRGGGSGTGAQALKGDDPIWATWRAANVTRLHVIVDPPPGVSPDAATWTRDVAPMSGTWANDEVKVWVDASGVRLDRSPLPDK